MSAIASRPRFAGSSQDLERLTVILNGLVRLALRRIYGPISSSVSASCARLAGLSWIACAWL